MAANILKRGGTYFVRLTVPKDRWGDVGQAMGAPNGVKREIVRTLQTTDFREAQRRREEGLMAARAMVDDALRRHRLKPLTDWTANWLDRAVELRSHRQAGARTIVHSVVTHDGTEMLVTEADMADEAIEAAAEEIETRRGLEAARAFAEIAFGAGMSVAEGSRQWLASIKGQVREGTWRGYEASLGRLGDHLATHEGLLSLEGVSLSAVTRRMAGEIVAARRAERASETVQRDFSAWNGLWRWAVRRGYAEVNPWTDQTAGLKAPRADDADRQKRAYTPAELVKLLRAGGDVLAPVRGGYGAALWDVIRLGLLTGARASELVGLRVGDVIEDGTAIATPKRGKSESAPRIIPLHAFAQSVIKARVASLPDLAPDALLWPEVAGADQAEKKAKTLVNRFIAVRRRVLGEDDGADLHSLRRSFMTAAETALHAGGRINPELTDLIVGHKRGRMALDLYSEWSRLGRRQMVGGMAEKLATLRAAVDDVVALGFPPEVLKALEETQGDRPAVVRVKPAFSRR